MTAQQLAQTLIDRELADGDGAEAVSAAVALAADNLYRSLARWIGADGCHALFARARSETESGHPALASLRLRARSSPFIEGIAESVRDHGESATADAIAAMMVCVIDLLGRLIGMDMATTLIERTSPESPRYVPEPQERRAKA